MKENFEIFEEILDEMELVYKNDNRPWMIGFSGGKDSTLLCCLAIKMVSRLPKKVRNKKIYIVSSDTGVENPIVKDYMHKMSKMINTNCASFNIQADIIYPKIDDSFWCKLIGLGYPTPEPPGFRWCTERLKIRPMNLYTKQKIKNNGQVVLLLGVRKAESAHRARNIKSREIEGKLLVPHNDIENAYVYNPLSNLPNDMVWKYLLAGDAKTPWGSDNNYLFSLYQGELLGEEESVIGQVDERKMKITGNSRFGCWICTMVKEDKSLKAFIDKGEKWLIPLRDYRNWLVQLRNNPKYRESKRRNGSMYRKPDGTIGLGPFTFEARYLMLEKLLKLQKDIHIELITQSELKEIDKMWDAEGDLSRRKLVNLYYKIFSSRLPWDEYKKPLLDEEVVNLVNSKCKEYKVENELISKLIVAIEDNKNYIRSSVTTKAFDRVINEGWLHFYEIEKGLKDANK